MFEKWQFDNNPYNRKRNKYKAVYGLIGLLRGITADRNINTTEAIYLKTWLDNNQHLRNDPDAKDLLCNLSDILADGRVDHDERADILQQALDTIEYREDYDEAGYSEEASFKNELLAYLQGVNADNVINLQEAQELANWIDNHPQHHAQWPVPDIKPRLADALADGNISPEESADLSRIFAAVTGCEFHTTGVPGGLSAWSMLEDRDQVAINNATIAFTGTFTLGNRNTLHAIAQEHGAIVKTGISKKLDYLFVGSILTPDWMFTSHGRKIQAALELKHEGQPIALLSEECFKASISLS